MADTLKDFRWWGTSDNGQDWTLHMVGEYRGKRFHHEAQSTKNFIENANAYNVKCLKHKFVEMSERDMKARGQVTHG